MSLRTSVNWFISRPFVLHSCVKLIFRGSLYFSFIPRLFSGRARMSQRSSHPFLQLSLGAEMPATPPKGMKSTSLSQEKMFKQFTRLKYVMGIKVLYK